MKQIILALMLTGSALAQSITIPAQNVSVTINKVKYTITVPAQTVKLPPYVLPAGLTWTPATSTASGVLTIPGNVSASSLILTGGPALPKSDSGLYLLQMQANGFLTPTPYVPYVLPALTIVAGGAK